MNNIEYNCVDFVCKNCGRLILTSHAQYHYHKSNIPALCCCDKPEGEFKYIKRKLN